MKRSIFLTLVAMMVVTMTSCLSVNLNNNSGDYDTTPTLVASAGVDTRMQPFDQVSVANAFKVIYAQGDNYSVRIDASEQALKEMTVYVKDNELRIRKAVKKLSPDVVLSNVKVYVTSPDIKMIDLAGSGIFTASQPISVEHDLNMDIAGSGKVLLVAVDCHNSDMEIAGSGDIEIGNLGANDVKAEIAGSGDIKLGVMTCNKFDIDIAGSGDVSCDNINAENVSADIAGSGDVNLKGTVKHHTKDIAGSGKVNILPLE